MERISKAIAVGLVLSTVVFAAFAGSRADQITIALLGGVFIGLLISVPSAILAIALILRRRDTQIDLPRLTMPTPPSVPTYWLPQQPNSAYLAKPNAYSWLPGVLPEFSLPAPRRRFYVIGESGEVREIISPAIDGELIDDESKDARL
jgi:hypothetical protein